MNPPAPRASGGHGSGAPADVLPHAPIRLDRREDAATPRRLSVKTLSWPARWERLFGRDRPLVVEIGFGRGEFLFHLAEMHPDANIIGIEVSNRSLESAERRILNGDAPNVRVVHAAAETALVHLFTPRSIQEVHVNFPDPWFKARHADRRLMRPAVVALMADRLVLGGRLFVATDIAEYAEMTDRALSGCAALKNDLDTPWRHEMPDRIETKYEGRAKAAGRTRHYFRYHRSTDPSTGTGSTPSVVLPQEFPMPHLVVTGTIRAEDIQDAFGPPDVSADGANISYLGAYRDRDGERLLVDTFVREPTISQRCAIVVTFKDDAVAVSLGMIGLPRPTPGIHLAVARLGAWIQTLDESLEVDAERTSIAADARSATDLELPATDRSSPGG